MFLFHCVTWVCIGVIRIFGISTTIEHGNTSYATSIIVFLHVAVLQTSVNLKTDWVLKVILLLLFVTQANLVLKMDSHYFLHDSGFICQA